jgi:hypothetical protein
MDPLFEIAFLVVAAIITPSLIQWASAKQKYCFEYGPYPIMASGGWNAAKTTAFIFKLLYLLDTYPKSRAVVVRKVKKEMERTTMTSFFKWCSIEYYDKGRRDDREGILEFNNGSRIHWFHMDSTSKQDRYTALQGLELNFAFLDQAEELPEAAFTTVDGRLERWDGAIVPQRVIDDYERRGQKWLWKNPVTGRPHPPPYLMGTCNPDNEDHWIWRNFHPDSREWQQVYKKLNYRFVHMPSWENRFASRENLRKLRSKDPAWVARYYDGTWGYPEGRIHTIDRLSLLTSDKDDERGQYVDTDEFLKFARQSCSLYRSMDHGDAAPTCCLWWAVDHEGNIFCFREYYRDHALITDHRKAIAKMSGEEEYKSSWADPSIFHKHMQRRGRRFCIADEYKDVDYNPEIPPLFWQKASNSELSTRNRINEYLQVDPNRKHPITGEMGSPRLFFLLHSPKYPGIEYATRQLRSQRRSKIDERAGRPIFSDDRDSSIDDHAYDAIRYFMWSRATPGHKEKPFDTKTRYDDIPEMIRNARRSARIQDFVRHRRQRF